MDWDRVRQRMAMALGWIKAREMSEQALNTTFEQAILEELVRIDSTQLDAVATLGEGNLVTYRNDGSVRPGALQRLEELEAYFYGTEDSQGLIQQLRDGPDPSLTER